VNHANDADLRQQQKDLLFPNVSTYYQEPLVVESASGMTVKAGGRDYLDFFGGILTVSVGHCHPEVTEAVVQQQRTLVHASTLYVTKPQLELAAKLVQLSPIKPKTKVFFTNSGTEANETAVNLAKVATGVSDFIALRHSYGGRGTLAMSMMGNKHYRHIDTQIAGVKHAHAPYCYRCDFKLSYPSCELQCAKDLKTLLETETRGRIAAFMAEPIQGVGGFITPPKEYFKVALPIIQEAGGLFIADEVQTAWGRTGGRWWGVEQYGVTPDIVTSAKGMANGQPIGVTLARADLADKLGGLAGISTFGGSPISMVASLKTLEVIEKERLLENAEAMGRLLRDGLEQIQKSHPRVGDVRGMGLMQAVELVKDPQTKEPDPQAASRVMEEAKQRGLLLGKGGTYGNVLRIAPPLIVSRAQVVQALEAMALSIREALS
jgi:4-aminobutyrate aminotransferase-like enzyme